MTWTQAERDHLRADVTRWKLIVLQTALRHRKRHPWRIWFAKQLRRLTVMVEP